MNAAAFAHTLAPSANRIRAEIRKSREMREKRRKETSEIFLTQTAVSTFILASVKPLQTSNIAHAILRIKIIEQSTYFDDCGCKMGPREFRDSAHFSECGF